MRNFTLILPVFLALFFCNTSFAQRGAGDDKTTEVKEVKVNAYEQPIRDYVGSMKDNLQLSEVQTKELLDFYLSTPIYFASMNNEAIDAEKEASMAKQEAKIKEVLTQAQLEKLLSKKEEAYQVLMKNMPK